MSGITQISKIQVRRGLRADLPQLAGGELGWAIDTQELFIGNGTIVEGAPAEGNSLVSLTSATLDAEITDARMLIWLGI